MPSTPHRVGEESDVIYTGTDFKLVGPPGHRKRVILLDVLIRARVNDPTLEIDAGGTIRYYVPGPMARLRQEVYANAELRNAVDMNHALGIIQMRPRDCVNCGDPWYEHLNDKCLFASTRYAE